MTEAYRSQAEANSDRAKLERLRGALAVAPRALRLDDCRLWTLRGRRGHASTWGDGETFCLCCVSPDSFDPGRTQLAAWWGAVKRRLSWCKVAQDGDDEGVLRLTLPQVELTPEQAEDVRYCLRLPKRVEF